MAESEKQTTLQQSEEVSCYFCIAKTLGLLSMKSTLSKFQQLPLHTMCDNCQHRLTDLGGTSDKLLPGQHSKPSAESMDTTNVGLDGDQPIPEVYSVSDNHEEHRKLAPELAPGEGGNERPGERQKTDDQAKPPRNTARLGGNRMRSPTTVLDLNVPTHGIGIHYNKKRELWEAHLRIPSVQIPGRAKPGMQIFLGMYETSDDAMEVYDRVALKLRDTYGVTRGLNGPESLYASYMEAHKGWSFRDFVWKFRREAQKFTQGRSLMKGVSVRGGVGKPYGAAISHTYSGQKILYDLGGFENEEEAGKAYDRALLFIHQKLSDVEQLHVITNFRPSEYPEADILGAGKAKGFGGGRDIRIA